MINLSQHGLFAAFLTESVEFAVVGGIAVNLHGFNRSTSDLDVFIRPTVSNAQAAFRALKAIDAPLGSLEWSDLRDDEQHYRFFCNAQHIDILSSIGAMPFDHVWLERIEVEVDGLSIPFISKARLLENKRATGRLRDLVDVEELEALPDE